MGATEPVHQREGRFSDGEFMEFLLERWEKEGNRASSFHKKVWRWLSGERIAQNPAEKRYVRVVTNWAFNNGDNNSVWQQRKARGYYGERERSLSAYDNE